MNKSTLFIFSDMCCMWLIQIFDMKNCLNQKTQDTKELQSEWNIVWLLLSKLKGNPEPTCANAKNNEIKNI